MPNVDQIASIAPYLSDARDIALYVIIAEIALRASKPLIKTVLFRLIGRKISKTNSNERLLAILSAALIGDYGDVTMEGEKISLKKGSSEHGKFKALKKPLKRINPGTPGE